MNVIRVLISDDHPIVRKGLRQLLDAEADVLVIDEASDGMETLDKVRAQRPDVLLLDVAMPRMSGIEVARVVKSALPETRIVVLSMFEKEAYARQALEAGALGYVLKGGPSEEILTAIRTVSRGQYYLSSTITSSVVSTYLKTQGEEVLDAGYRSLSDRERQVFLLLVEGNSIDRIGNILCISPKTVEKHRSNITLKLGVSNPLEMLKYAVRIGVVDPEIWHS